MTLAHPEQNEALIVQDAVAHDKARSTGRRISLGNTSLEAHFTRISLADDTKPPHQ